jgi:hypothetical protein
MRSGNVLAVTEQLLLHSSAALVLFVTRSKSLFRLLKHLVVPMVHTHILLYVTALVMLQW